MTTFTDTFRTILWAGLCVFMVVGMVAFAILYAMIKFILNSFAWKEMNFSIPSLRISKIKTAVN